MCECFKCFSQKDWKRAVKLKSLPYLKHAKKAIKSAYCVLQVNGLISITILSLRHEEVMDYNRGFHFINV